MTSEAADAPLPPLRIIEALLFAGGGPLSAERACEIVRGLTVESFSEALAALNRDYRRQGRPYTIQPGRAGWEMVLRPAFRAVRERMQGGTKEARLSQPALDVLSLVAFRQPVTRQEVDSLRGGDSQSQLRQLVRLGLIAVQRGDGKEVHYGTTTGFLRMFGLRNLDDLPRIQELQRM